MTRITSPTAPSYLLPSTPEPAAPVLSQKTAHPTPEPRHAQSQSRSSSPDPTKTTLAQARLSALLAQPSVTTYTLDQAREATRELNATSIEESLPLKPGESQTFFGLENQSLKSITTFLASAEPDMKDLAKGNLYFLNSYSPKLWVMQNNMRDSKLASFKMADIVQIQAGKAELTTGPEVMVRAAIHSIKGESFFKANALTHGEVMSPAQFDDFMKNTPNGWSSKSILAKFDMEADKALVLREANSAKQSPEEPDHVYSVAIFTKPATAHG